MCVQDSIGVEEQANLVENMPQIDEYEMLHTLNKFVKYIINEGCNPVYYYTLLYYIVI